MCSLFYANNRIACWIFFKHQNHRRLLFSHFEPRSKNLSNYIIDSNAIINRENICSHTTALNRVESLSMKMAVVMVAVQWLGRWADPLTTLISLCLSSVNTAQTLWNAISMQVFASKRSKSLLYIFHLKNSNLILNWIGYCVKWNPICNNY